ncbi:MAG: tetratricopeptide repeat protein, partial [Victivallaceae bacterium]
SHKTDAEFICGFSIIFDKAGKVIQWDPAYTRNVAKPNPKIDKEAFERYKKSATEGDPKAQCNLGMCYFNGEYTVKDDKEAAKWLAKAASQGDARAGAMLDSLNLRKLVETSNK